MTDVRDAVENERLQKGVFQPSRAEIAREMKCRLNLCDEEPESAPVDRSLPELHQVSE